MLVEKQIIVEGLVQGVGFRARVRELALRLTLKGTVRNLADGCVEIHVQGESTVVDSFITTIRHRPGAGKVSALHIQNVLTPNLYTHFSIENSGS